MRLLLRLDNTDSVIVFYYTRSPFISNGRPLFALQRCVTEAEAVAVRVVHTLDLWNVCIQWYVFHSHIQMMMRTILDSDTAGTIEALEETDRSI